MAGLYQMTWEQVAAVALHVGWSPAEAVTATSITEPESNREPRVIQAGQPYATTGWGLWQITPGDSEPQIGVDAALFDPLTNAKAAVAKYDSQGLGAWTTYTSGAYKQFLQTATPVSPGTTQAVNAAQTALNYAGGTGGNGGGWTSALGGVFPDVASGLFSWPGAIIGTVADVDKAVISAYDGLKLFFQPSTYVRIGAGLAGAAFIVLGIVCLAREASS